MPKACSRRVAIGVLALLTGCLEPPLTAAGVVVQNGARFPIDSWTTEHGLPQNSVIAMTLAQDGYLWLGTLSGLVRFDGFRFPVFDANNTPELRGSQIVYLFEDSRANLWIGTLAGVTLARKDGRVTSLELGRTGHEGRLMAACEDADGAVWLYTADGKLGRHRGGQMDVFNVEADWPSYCRAVIRGEDGRILVGTDTRLYVIPPTAQLPAKALPREREMRLERLDYLLASRHGGHWQLADGRIQKWTRQALQTDLGSYPWPSSLMGSWPNARIAVTSACEDQNGNLVVGTLGAGVFWSDDRGKWTNVSTNDGLSSNAILSLQMDREGTLWVGTDGNGLNRIRRQVFGMLEASRGQVVQSVSEDAQGGVYVGYNNVGVDYWKDGVLSKVNPGSDMMNMSVKSVFVDRKQRVWAGTSSFLNAGLFQLQDHQFQRVMSSILRNRDVSAIHEDLAGRLWVGTRGGLVGWQNDPVWRLFTTSDGLSADDVSAIAEDRDGSIWAGTRGGGLNRLRDGRFSVFRKSSDGLPGDDVSALLVDGEGVLWVGTDGGGLARYQGEKWTRYSTKEGLISNSITYLLEDAQGYLWIGSSAGLMRVLKESLNDFAKGVHGFISLRAYGRLDGLPIGECSRGSQPAACRTSQGKLLFPTIHGLAIVDPAQLRPNTNPPPVTIESVFIGGEQQGGAGLRAPRPEAATIPAGQEGVEIHYTSLNLSAPERARFRYRLEGHETVWVEAANARVAHYSKLPPGNYRFRVTACNEDGVWNEAGAVLALTVLPPFYLTWWFLTGSSITLLGGIVSVVRYFSVQKLERELAVLRQHEALEKERARIARDIHDQLGASLTQVTLLGEMVEADKSIPHEVEAHARQICQTARDTTRSLDEIVWTVNPSNDTLEGLANYICKYAQDYLGVAGVRCRLEVPPDLPPTPIPPEVRHNAFLAAKEAVTNVARHAKASSAWIRLQLESGRFRLEIADDGRGLAGMDEKRAATRNGLRNMRKRMEDVGGAFEMGPAPEGGLRICLTVPVGK